MVLLKNGNNYYCSDIYCMRKMAGIAPKYYMVIESANGKGLQKLYDTEILCDAKITTITTALRDNTNIIITL